MYTENVCRFVPTYRDYDIHTVNYVYETSAAADDGEKRVSACRMCWVAVGSAVLEVAGCSCTLRENDVFFLFPSVPYTLRAEGAFHCVYVSYFGVRASQIMEQLGIRPRSCVFPDFPALRSVWLDPLDSAPDVLHLCSEAILLYTFAALGSRTCDAKKKARRPDDPFFAIRQYVESHFPDGDLSLGTLQSQFSYHRKYLSTLFKKRLGLCFSDYLNLIRIQHACALMSQGVCSVKEIAARCGYRDAHYFSRVFRARMGCTPKEHIRLIAEEERQSKA